MYFLRSMTDEDGTNLFAVCVSELVMENRDFNLLFGFISPDGCRTPGLLESMGIAAGPIIEYCASESENNGLLEDAVALYDLANKPDQALKVLIRLVALNVTKNPLPDSPRQRIQRLALSLAERYHKSPPNFVQKSAASTFFILVDLMTFFDEYHAGRHDNALLIIERMKIIPLYKEEIEPAVANFHLYSDEIRMNIPDLIVATMEALHAKFKKLKAETKTSFIPSEGAHPEVQYLLDIKEKVRTIITYCGMIPYFMTSDVYSKLLHMEVQIG
jgi:nuclear pore complex protein Nup93